MLHKLNLHTKDRLATLMSYLVILSIAFAAYSYTVLLPFYWDDLWHFLGHVSPFTLKQIIVDWRPLQFATYWVFLKSQGYFSPPVLHLFSLGMHLLNCCLCYFFLSYLRVPNRRLLAFAGALFFALYPFSAQAVAWVAALGHLWVGTLVLGSLVLYQASMNVTKGSTWLRCASLVLAFLAPLANEAGLVIFVLVALLLLVDRIPINNRRWLGLIPFVICAIASLIVMRLIRPIDSRIAGFALNFNDIKEKFVYAIQALAYPFAPAVTWLYRRGVSVDVNLFAFISYSFVIAAYLHICWRLNVLRYAVLGTGLFFITIAPAFIIMTTEYVLSGPRLLYIGALGASLLWALLLTSYNRLPFRNGMRVTVAAVYILLVAVSGVPYLSSVRGLSLETKRIVDELKITYRGVPNPVLSVNFPSALFLNREVNLVGSYRPSILPESSPEDLDNLLALNGAPGHQIKHLRIQEYFPQENWKYRIAYWIPNSTPIELVRELRNYASVYRAAALDTIIMREAGGLEAVNAPFEGDYLAQFDNQVALLNKTLISVGSEITVTLHWQCLQPIEHQTQVFIQVYDENGNTVIEQDQQPLLGMSDLSTWQVGDIWRDVRYISLPNDLPSGTYRLEVGVYTLPGVVRLPAYDSSNQRLVLDALLIAAIQQH